MKKLLFLFLLLALPASAQTPDSSLPNLLSHRVVLMRDSTTGALVPMLADDGQGPLTPGGNVRARTDGNGYLIVAGGVYTSPDGPLTPFANLRVRTDSNGYLLVTFGSGGYTAPLTISADGIATTSTDGLILSNSTAATVGATVQMSPRALFTGQGWDSDDSVSRPARFGWQTLPVSGTTVSGVAELIWLDPITNAITKPLTVTSAGAVTTTGDFRLPSGILRSATIAGGNGLYVRNAADSANGNFEAVSLILDGKMFAYNGVTTAGWGVPAIYAAGAPGSKVNTGTAAIATYTVGAADGDFEVSATCLVTVATTHSFSLDAVYTDTSNVSRTMVLPVNALAGNFITSGLITNVTGAGNYESAVMHISAKAGTSVTVRTSAGGTFTTVTYFPRAVIKQTTP